MKRILPGTLLLVAFFCLASPAFPQFQITSTSPLPPGEVNAHYTFQFSTAGGPDSAIGWTSNTVPPGLTLDPNDGTLSGYPSAAVTDFSFTVVATAESGQQSTSKTFTFTANPAVTISNTPPNADAGSYYFFTFQAAGGQSPYTWSADSGLPPGLQMDSGGNIQGTPTSTGSFGFYVTVTDSAGGSTVSPFQIVVNPSLVITSASLPPAEVSAPYSYQFTATGGSGAYTWSVAPESSLPPGLSISPGGLLSGTPTQAGPSYVSVMVTDTSSGSAIASFQIPISSGPAITSTSPLPGGSVGTSYSFYFQASSGSGSYTWSVPPGALPAGLTLNQGTGQISGTPTTAGTSNFAITVLDSAGGSATSTFALTIITPLSITSASPLPGGDVSHNYSFTFAATGGTSPYTWSLPSGSVPPAGLSLSSSGTLGGTPTASGLASFAVQVSDAAGHIANKTFQVQISAAPSITTASPLPNGTVNVGYGPLTFAETGGTAPFTWTSSTPPPGLNFTSGGVLSGTPTTAGAGSISVTVTDAAGATASGTFSLTILAPLAVTSTSPLAAGTVGSQYSFTFQASGGSGGYTWSLASGSLPAGLTLNGSGLLSGTPSVAATSSFVITVHDSSGGTASGPFSLTINSGVTITSASPLATGEVSRPYSFTFTATGGTGSYTWSVPSGSSLPAGLTLSSGGALAGTPTASGTNTFSVQATDGSGNTATKSVQLQILAAPSITTTSPLPNGTLNHSYNSVTFTETGGTAPFQWSASGLPAGLTFSSSGTLSGTPTAAGTSNITVTLTDAAGATTSGTFSLSVYAQLTISSTSPLPGGAVNSAYSFTFQAGGGSGSYTWSLVSGSLPTGLTLNTSTGAVSGTPTAAGASSFTIGVRDSAGTAVASPFTLDINSSLSITSASPLTAGEVSRPYSFAFTGTGGSGSYTWSLPSGSTLPAGLSLSAGGALAGTPTVSSTSSFSVQLADGSGNTTTKAFQLQIVAAPAITTTSPLPTGTLNHAYASITFAESGGTAPFQWTASGLPPGLSLSSAGLLSGTPTSVGTSSVSVTLTDAAGATASSTFSLTVFSQLAISSASPLTAGAVNSSYSFTFQAGGGSGSYTWSIASGSLPAGLSLGTSTGLLTGTPTTAGTSNFVVTVHDGSGATANGSFALTINSTLSITSASTLTSGEVSRPYSFSFTATGGSGSYTWSLPSGSTAPAGLTLNPGGSLAGTPTASGASSFSVQVTDGSGNTAIKTFQLRMVAAPAITTSSPLPTGTLNHAYASITFAESGGTSPFQWSASGLPAGLSLSSAGVLSGTPTSPGTAAVSVTLTDAAGATASATFSLSVVSQLTITSSSPLTAGTVNSAYTFGFQAGGGTSPYTWTVSSGSAPAGLALAGATGVLSGTPTTAGTSNFGITVHDASGATATGSFALTINSSLSITSASPLTAAEVSRSYSFTFTGTGGSGSYTWSVSSGSTLPPGLSLNAAGILGGTPTTPGTTTFSVQLTDSSGSTAAKTVQLQVVAAPTITTVTPLPAGTLNSSYGPLTFTGSGGTTPYHWSGSSLPAGLTLSTGGVLNGTPTAAGTSTISITLTDAAGAATSATFPLTVYSQLTIASSSPLPAAALSSSYSFTFQAGGGSGSYSWSVVSGSLPSGLSLNSSTGTLSGTPTSLGTSGFVIQVSDPQRESTASKTFSLTVNTALSITSASPLTAGEVSRHYSFSFTGTGGSGSYTWSLPSGSTLPAGLALNSSGGLSGTPTAAGNTSFSVQMTDSSGATTTKSFQLQIVAAPSITTTSPLAAGTPNTSYGPITFTETGGTAPFSWSSSQLPAGLTLSSAGVLRGTPTTAGTDLISVTVTDGAGATATATFSLSVVSQLAITSASPLPGGTAGSSYSFTFQAGGGSGSYSWSVASGSLPSGLLLNGTSGQLSGTPTGAGNFAFVIQVSDTQTDTQTTKSFSLRITSAFAITSPATLPGGTTGTGYSQPLTSTGGVAPITWSVASGSLPGGLSLNNVTGSIAGTPSAPGTFTFSVQAVDSATPPATATKSLTIVIAAAIPPLRITSPATLSGQLGTTYSFMFTATGGTPPYAWSLGGTLPPGLALASGSGVLSGKPSGVGPYSFAIQVTDSAGMSAAQQTQLQFTLPQAPPLQITGIPSNPAANSQPSFQVTIPSPFTFDIQGVLAMTFNSPSGINDPAVQFTNGTRSLAFTIPAGSTSAVYANGESPVFLTGTVAGTITLTTAQYQALGLSLSPVPPPVQVVIPATAPVITSVTATRSSGGFTLTIIGYSPTRDVTSGSFSFLGSNLDTPQLTVDLSTLFQSWFSNTTSDQFGSQFKLTQPFNLNGGSGNVKTVSVTLTNSIGASVLVTAPVE